MTVSLVVYEFPVFYKTQIFFTYLLQSTSSPFSEPNKSFAHPSILFLYDPVYDYDHVRKIRSRRQRTDIGKYSFVNRTIRLWNRLPAEILETVPSKPNAFRKRVRKVINVVN
jgi:hypothetical protein